jgi:hypothetical protein
MLQSVESSTIFEEFDDLQPPRARRADVVKRSKVLRRMITTQSEDIRSSPHFCVLAEIRTLA